MATILDPAPSSPVRLQPVVMPLQNGDHLSRDDFHARYLNTPKNFRAELVKGTVIVPSPLGCPHGHYHALAIAWLITYQASTPGTRCYDNTTTIFDDQNEFQPDCSLVILPSHGGKQAIPSQYIEGAPQLVVEVAGSSRAYDLFEKYEIYEKLGVQEYVVILLEENEIRWHRAEGGKFALVHSTDGLYRSIVCPGLWLNQAAFLGQDAATLIKSLGEGIATPEHAAFVEALHKAATSSTP
jgi:Uma2 family endonuclease